MSGFDPPFEAVDVERFGRSRNSVCHFRNRKTCSAPRLQGPIHPQSRTLHQASKLEIMKCAASVASQPIGKPLGDFLSGPFQTVSRRERRELDAGKMGHSRNEIMVKKWEWSSDMRDFQEDMTQKSPDTLERFIQVFATLNGGLTDVTLLNERQQATLCTALARRALSCSAAGRPPSSRRSGFRNASRSQRSVGCRRRDAS